MSESPTTSVPGCSNCLRLERELHELRAELAELRRQVNRNSGNSSLPPSANPPWAPGRGGKKPTGRKPGGQAGHEGHHRRMLPLEEVDEVVKHRPKRCRGCGAELSDVEGLIIDRHQISELPKRAVKVTEHQALACTCGRCGQVSKGAIPEELSQSVLGERLTAAVAFVSSRVHGSRRAVQELLQEMLGVELSLGTVINREKEVTAALNAPYRQAKEAIQKAPAKNVDETGWKRAGRFLWVAANKTLAVFHLDPCRNREAMHQLLGVQVTGTICTDRYGVYQQVPIAQRALCWAHLKRDFQELLESVPGARRLGEAGVGICRQVFDLGAKFKNQTIGRHGLKGRAGKLRKAMRALLERGRCCRSRRASHFCKDLLRWEEALWTFAQVEGIEPTNNHAERMLRPAVMWRKQSLGSHSLAGCRFVERMMTVLQTRALRGQRVMDYLEQAVHALRYGTTPPSLIA